MAAVERLESVLLAGSEDGTVTIDAQSLRDLLAVVEAVKDLKDAARFYQAKPSRGLELFSAANRFDAALARLYAGSSGESD